MFAVIDAECGYLSQTIQNKEEFINKSPVPICLSEEREAYYFLLAPFISTWFCSCPVRLNAC